MEQKLSFPEYCPVSLFEKRCGGYRAPQKCAIDISGGRPEWSEGTSLTFR
jgi:hypothetical protein